MTKIKALITLVVGKGVEVLPDEVTDVSEMEARRLIGRNFAEELPKTASKNNKSVKSQGIVSSDEINKSGEETQGDEDDSDEQGDE